MKKKLILLTCLVSASTFAMRPKQEHIRTIVCGLYARELNFPKQPKEDPISIYHLIPGAQLEHCFKLLDAAFQDPAFLNAALQDPALRDAAFQYAFQNTAL